MIALEFPSILLEIDDYTVAGRTDSAAFLMWYLEKYYRLDPYEAIDHVCDQSGDRGIDGIFINNANGTIDVFQSKISQAGNRTVGDKVLREFLGSLSQLNSAESIENILEGGDSLLKGLIKRLDLKKYITTYKIRGIFIANIDLDENGVQFLKTAPDIEFYGKSILESTYISDSKNIYPEHSASFTIDDIQVTKHHADADTFAIIAPIKASELVNIPGISDQSIFDFNVRGSLGKTKVNKDIEKSIKDPELHKQFPLFHNGITIVANEIEEQKDTINIRSFYVVNGCQSLTALYNNRTYITNELRILTKIVLVSTDTNLARDITRYSNNQNGVKPRDFKSNNSIQVRLQNEFKNEYANSYFFEIKRGETTPEGTTVISNEYAGILLMSFDLAEPWATHRKYQIFDDKYTDIFGKPSVTAHLILALYLIDQVIISKLSAINNQLISKYALTRYVLLYIVKCVLQKEEIGDSFFKNPKEFVHNERERAIFKAVIGQLIDEIIIDFNAEVDSLGDDFDYKSKLRDESWVKNLSQEVVGSHLKLVARNRIPSITNDWHEKIAK